MPACGAQQHIASYKLPCSSAAAAAAHMHKPQMTHLVSDVLASVAVCSCEDHVQEHAGAVGHRIDVEHVSAAALGAGPGICRGSNIVLHTPTRATGSRQLLLDSHPSIACCWQCCQVVHNPQLLLSTPAAPAMIAHAPPQLHRPCPAVTQTASCGWARGLPSTVPG